MAPLRSCDQRHLGRTRRHQDDRVRRLSVRGTAHSLTAPVVLVAVDRGARERHVRQEFGRRASGHGGGTRARAPRPPDPGARHLGAGAALRRRDAVSRRVGRSPRRAHRGDRHRGGGRRPALRGRAPAQTHRREHRRQRRASRHVATARGAVRRVDRRGDDPRAGDGDALRRRTRRRDPGLPPRPGSERHRFPQPRAPGTTLSFRTRPRRTGLSRVRP